MADTELTDAEKEVLREWARGDEVYTDDWDGTLFAAVESIVTAREQAARADVWGETQGLIDKFKVWRNHDPTHKHDDCRYFVLDPQHDPMALDALAVYAREARLAGYTALADDLKAWIRQIEDGYKP